MTLENQQSATEQNELLTCPRRTLLNRYDLQNFKEGDEIGVYRNGSWASDHFTIERITKISPSGQITVNNIRFTADGIEYGKSESRYRRRLCSIEYVQYLQAHKDAAEKISKAQMEIKQALNKLELYTRNPKTTTEQLQALNDRLSQIINEFGIES